MEKELLSSFYSQLFDLIGENATQIYFKNYQGLTINVPKKLYDGKKVAEKLLELGDLDMQTKQHFARKYDYSQRQLERLLALKTKR